LNSAYIFRAVKKELKKYINKSNKVLDLGCGNNSIFTNGFKSTEYKYFTGLDLSLKGLKILKGKFDSEKKQSVVMANVLYLPFKRNSHDLIVSISMIEYLHDEHLQQFFREIERVISKDGLIILAFPNYDSLIRKKCMDYSRKHRIRDCEDDHRTYASVEPFIKSTNLKVIKDYTIGITTQLFYLNYFFHKGGIKKILRKFVTLITTIIGTFFFWINFIIRTKGDYHITILKKC